MALKRYHIKVYFPENNDLQEFTEKLNSKKWLYSSHCLENIKYRILDVEKLLQFIKILKLKTEDIFEYYKSKEVEKACYRIHYKGNIDIILVISAEKRIVTIYINEKGDNHITLKKELYIKKEGL